MAYHMQYAYYGMLSLGSSTALAVHKNWLKDLGILGRASRRMMPGIMEDAWAKFTSDLRLRGFRI